MEFESDDLLVGIFESGDRRSSRAVEILFRRHLPRVYSLCRRYFSIKEDAEEAASETFFRAFRGLAAGQFRGDASYKTWLLRIAANTCIERVRQPRLPILSLETMGERAEMIAAPTVLSSVTDAVCGLPDDQSLAVTLCDLEGYSVKEAALIMGRSTEALKSLHYRARRALRDRLTDGE